MLVNDTPPGIGFVYQLGMDTRDIHVTFKQLVVRSLTTTYNSSVDTYHTDVEDWDYRASA